MVLPQRSPVNKRKLVLITVAAVIVIGIIVGIALYFTLVNNEETPKQPPVTPTPGPLRQAAIAANGYECAAIGKNILMQNGSVADAAIATLFCEGVSCPQSMGLGGGFVLTIYTKKTNTVENLIAREWAPLAADENMYENDTDASSIGGKAMAVPGELKGYWELHQKYGKLSWATLIAPTIELCENGHIVTEYLARILALRQTEIAGIPSLAEIFINPETNQTWIAGDKIKRLKLAESLKVIAKEGADALYNGSLTDGFIADIQSFDGIITKDDLLEYSPVWTLPVQSLIFNEQYRFFSTPLPASGHVLAFILNIISDYIDQKPSTINFHRIVESFKFAYARRSSLGDLRFVPEILPIVQNLSNPDYAKYIRTLIDDELTHQDYEYYGANFSQPEDHGTAHVSIIGPNGDAIAVTSTINNILGCRRRSQSTGIILNDEMDDFGVPNKNNSFGIPPSPANFIRPKKWPLSSMVPTILLNKSGDVEMIIGGAGGSKITTAVAYTIIRHLWFNEKLDDAISAKRLHHQLAPMEIQYEGGFPSEMIKELQDKQHLTKELPNDSGFAALTAIAREGDGYKSVIDPRRGGSTESFKL